MSVKNILADLKKVVNNPNVERQFQYESHVIDFNFSVGLSADEIYRGIADYVERRRRGKVPPGQEYFTLAEKQALKSACSQAARGHYTVSNIKAAHSKRGYAIFSGATAEVDLAVHAGWPAGSAGQMTKTAQGKGKLGVIIRQGVNAPATGGEILGAGMNADVTATYIASMEGPSSTTHNRLINDLWYPAVKDAVSKFQAALPTLVLPAEGPLPAGQMPAGATPPQARVYSPEAGKTIRRGAVRLHGPLDSTKGGDDTSVPVVSIIDELKTLNPKNIIKPVNLQRTEYYNLAFRKVMSELDLEFKVNSNSITDIVTMGKLIRIKMAQGGQKDQTSMKAADKDNVNKVLDRIEQDLIQEISDPGYIGSTPVTKLAERVVVAQVVKNFVTKSGKPDMRYKINKQAALRGGKTQKERDKGILPLFKTGKITTTRKQRAKSAPSTKRKTRQGSIGRGASGSPIALKELINAALPEVMLLRMQPPALRNRTGRFRQSAEVTNVNIGPRGGTQIDYTYMRDPYDTFEPGGNMGSRNRDPRKIIGESVREIATKITGNKFITTRRQ